MDAYGFHKVPLSDDVDPWDVHTADVDGDGDTDIIIASYNNASGIPDAIWYENEFGDASSWLQRTLSTEDAGIISVDTGDMDGDEDPDIVAAVQIGDKVVWYENIRPIPTPLAIWQAQSVDPSSSNDIDLISEGEPFVVHWGDNAPDSSYQVYRKIDAGSYGEITPTPIYVRKNSVEGYFHFQEEDLPLGHYHYKVQPNGSASFQTDEESVPTKVWEGGIAVVTPTPVPPKSLAVYKRIPSQDKQNKGEKPESAPAIYAGDPPGK